MQYHVKANSRARVVESKVATLWLDRRFVDDKWLVRLVRKMTKRENVVTEQDLGRAMQRIGQFLDAATR